MFKKISLAALTFAMSSSVFAALPEQSKWFEGKQLTCSLTTIPDETTHEYKFKLGEQRELVERITVPGLPEAAFEVSLVRTGWILSESPVEDDGVHRIVTENVLYAVTPVVNAGLENEFLVGDAVRGPLNISSRTNLVAGEKAIIHCKGEGHFPNI